MSESGSSEGRSRISTVKRPLAWVYLAVTPSLVRVPVSPVRSMPLVRSRVVSEANCASEMGMEITEDSVLRGRLKSRFPSGMTTRKAKATADSSAALRNDKQKGSGEETTNAEANTVFWAFRESAWRQWQTARAWRG